ncbi:MAG: cytochrome C oxidase subunit IV family protein [Acidobacteriota bacterium]
MNPNHAEEIDIKKHVRAYMMVFGALWVLTVVTVAASYLDLSTSGSIALALFIAGIKGSLVASYFMHLISERKLIYLVLLLTAIFVIGLLLFPTFVHVDQVSS